MNTKKSLTVKEWSDEDKPREKLITQGKKALSNAELLAILIRSGIPGKTAVDVAKEILALSGGRLTDLSTLEHRRLAEVRGLGNAKAATLMAALELGWRMQSEMATDNKDVMDNSQSLFNHMLPLLIDLDHEEFWAVHLSNRNKVLGKQRISVGGLTETMVDLRLLFRGAIENRATRIAVLHNHPSGNLTPSRDDQQITARILEAGTILGIKLIDHLIIGINSTGKPDYYSFADHKLL